MLHRYLSTIGLAALLTVVSAAQQSTPTGAPPFSGERQFFPGISLKSVEGIPFSATEEIRNEMPLGDGTVDIKRTTVVLARDVRGRIHNERRSLVPEHFRGTPHLQEVYLFDPQTRIDTMYVPGSYLARQIQRPERTENAGRSAVVNPDVKIEDLGTATINGIFVRGTRRTTTLPARASSTGVPIAIINEAWYSEDLQINIQIRHTDPRTGTETVTLTNIVEAEPDATLFEIPDGYRIVDVTPPASATTGPQ
jgi:hypothetical protein